MDAGLSSNFLSSSRQRFLGSENSLHESFEFNDFLTFARSDITAKRESAAKNSISAVCRLPDDDSDFDDYLDAVADFFTDDEVVQVAILDRIKDIFAELKKITEPYEKACERIPSLILQCFGISKKVQNLAIQAVTSLIDEELLTREAVQNFIVPFLFDFVFDTDAIPCADGFNDRWSDRVHIVALLSKIATSVEQNLYSKRWVFEEFVPRYSGLFTDQNFVIRKLSIAALGIFARYFGQKFTEKCVIPHLEQAVADDNFRVRKLCCEVFVDIAKNSSAEVRAHVLTPRFLALLQDPNKNVYHAAVQQLGPFIATFADPRRTGIEFRDGRLVHVRAESPLETDENDVDGEGKPKDISESEAVDKVIMDDSSPSSSSSGGSPAQEEADLDENSVYDIPQGFMLPGDAVRQPTVSPPSSAGTCGLAAASPGDLNAALEGLLEHYDGESALDASFVAEDDDDEKADDGDEYFLDEDGPAAGDIFASSPILHLNFDEDEVDVEILSSSFGVNGETSWPSNLQHDAEGPQLARERLLTKLNLSDEKEETAQHDNDPDNDFPGFTSEELEMSELDLTIREEDRSADEDQLDDSGDESREPEPTVTRHGQPSASDEDMIEAADKPKNSTLELFESLEREIQAEQEGCDQQNTAAETSDDIPNASEKTNSNEFVEDNAASLQTRGSPTKELFDALDAMMENEQKSEGDAHVSPSSQEQAQPGESEVFIAQMQGIHESIEDTGTSSSSEYTSAASSTSRSSTTSSSSSSSSYWSFDSLFDVEPDELEAYEKRSAKNGITVKDADVVHVEEPTAVATEKPSVPVAADHSGGEKERMTYSEAVSSSMKESVCDDESLAMDEAEREKEPLLPPDEPSNVDDKNVEAEAPEPMEVACLDAYEQSLLNSPPRSLQALEAAGFWQKRIDFFCKSTKQLVKKTVDAAAAAATSSSSFRGTGIGTSLTGKYAALTASPDAGKTASTAMTPKPQQMQQYLQLLSEKSRQAVVAACRDEQDQAAGELEAPPLPSRTSPPKQQSSLLAPLAQAEDVDAMSSPAQRTINRFTVQRSLLSPNRVTITSASTGSILIATPSTSIKSAESQSPQQSPATRARLQKEVERITRFEHISRYLSDEEQELVLNAKQNIIPQELLDCLVSLEMNTDQDQLDVYRHIAHSIPAVAYTFGPENWVFVKGVYLALSNHYQPQVRATLAHSLHEIAAIIGVENTDRDLMPVFQTFLQDSSEIQYGLLKHLYEFCKLVSPEQREEIAKKLSLFVTCDGNRSWRLRSEFAEQLVKLVPLFSAPQVNAYLSAFALTFATDRVAEVRNNGVEMLAEVLALFVRVEYEQLERTDCSTTDHESMPLTERLLQEIRDGFWKTINWRRRQSFARLLETIIRKQLVTDEQFVSLFYSDFIDVAEDEVSNIRQTFASMMRYARRCDFFMPDHGVFNAVTSRLAEMAHEDPDLECRNLAKIALGELDPDTDALDLGNREHRLRLASEAVYHRAASRSKPNTPPPADVESSA